jgi:hypothetical protein
MLAQKVTDSTAPARALVLNVYSLGQKDPQSVFQFPLYQPPAPLVATEGRVQAIAWRRACGNPTPGGRASLIKDIFVDKRSVCPGEDIELRVATEHPEGQPNTVDVQINGVTASRRFLEFNGVGLRRITIVATTADGYVDHQTLTVNVSACNGSGQSSISPTVFAAANPFHDDTVDLVVRNSADLARVAPRYIWDFGDGQTAETVVPYVAHSYRDSLSPDEVRSTFQASVIVRESGRPDLGSRKTITLWNPYVLSKERGIIQPHVDTDGALALVGGNVVGEYSIENIENDPLSFASRQIEFQQCDPNNDPKLLPSEAITLTIPGRTKITQRIEVVPSMMFENACGIAIHLLGKDGRQRTTVASAYFDISRPDELAPEETDPAMIRVLRKIVAENLLPNTDLITAEQLRRLELEGKISLPDLNGMMAPSPPPPVAQGAPPIPGDSLGMRCLPGDTVPRPGLTCQRTNHPTLTQARIANALKGDLLLDAECDAIGAALRALTPRQMYTHEGIMTRNHYQVRHSTAVMARYAAYPNGVFGKPSDGIQEQALRFGWPGTLLHSIQAAYQGEEVTDPQSPSMEKYSVVAFASKPVVCEGDSDIAFPLVIKPTPGAPPTVRDGLKRAADMALGINAHYRFFAFTKADIGLDANYNAPNDGKWYDGSTATVSSQFIWLALHKSGVQLEGPLDAEDIVDVGKGARVDEHTRDGLYFYDAVNRRVGLEALYTFIYNNANDKTNVLGSLADAPDDIASQMANCFASDYCSEGAKDSDNWMNPDVGRAVSPDNFLFWDSPRTGGSYGHSEHLRFRGSDHGWIYQWAPSSGTGAVNAKVLKDGVLVTNATVVLSDMTGFTDSFGQIVFSAIPAGNYEIEAQLTEGARFLTVKANVEVRASETTEITLMLNTAPDANQFRRVSAQGTIYVVDDETWPFSDEKKLFRVAEFCQLNPTQRTGSIKWRRCVGDEVAVELALNCALQENQTTVRMQGVARLHESTGCGNERESKKDIDLVLPAGKLEPLIFTLTNPGFGGGDRADFNLAVVNGED